MSAWKPNHKSIKYQTLVLVSKICSTKLLLPTDDMTKITNEKEVDDYMNQERQYPHRNGTKSPNENYYASKKHNVTVAIQVYTFSIK